VLASLKLSPSFAKIGSTVSVDFEASEPLPESTSFAGQEISNPSLSLDGHAFSCSHDALAYHCTLEIEADRFQEGRFPLSILAFDQVGNRSQPLAVAPSLTLDFSPPLMTVNASPPEIEPSQALELIVRSSEALVDLPTVSSDFGVDPSCQDNSGVGREFVCTLVLGPEPVTKENSGYHGILVTGRDQAGNQSQGNTSVNLIDTSLVLDPASVTISPRVAMEGSIVNLQFEALKGTMNSCGVLVGTRVANCLVRSIDNQSVPIVSACECSFEVVSSVLEGIQTVVLSGRNNRGSDELNTQFNVDRSPPTIDGSKLHVHRTSIGLADTFFAEPGTAADDQGLPYTDPSPAIKRLRLYDGELSTNPVDRFNTAVDGTVGAASTPIALSKKLKYGLWVEAEDLAGNRSARVAAGQIEAEVSALGRIPYEESSASLTMYPFSTDQDPTTLSPGFGAAIGEANEEQLQRIASADGSSLSTHLDRLGWVSSSPPDPQFQLEPFQRIGRSGASSYIDPRNGDMELRGGTSQMCQNLRLRGALRYSSGRLFPGAEDATPARFYTPRGAFDPVRKLGIWTSGYGPVLECGSSQCEFVSPDVARRPTAAAYGGLAYHTGVGKMIYFGGFEAPGGVYIFYNETWAYDPADPAGPGWSQIQTPQRPGERMSFGITSDPDWLDAGGNKVGRVYIFGGTVGQNPAEQRYADLWAFDGINWTRLDTGGPAGARSHSVMGYDPIGDRLLISGGIRHVGTQANGNPDVRIDGDVFAYHLDPAWPSGSSRWETLRSSLVNGCSWNPPTPTPCDYTMSGGYNPFSHHLESYADGELWSFTEDPTGGSNGSWKKLMGRIVPTPREQGVLFSMPGRIELGLAGGFTNTGLVSSGLAVFNGIWTALPEDPLRSDLPPLVAAPTPGHRAESLFVESSHWSVGEKSTPKSPLQIISGDLPLPPSGFGGAAFDTARQRVVLLDRSIPPQTYSFKDDKLSKIIVSAPPPYRDRYNLSYDAAHDEILFFGGRSFNGTPSNELWSFKDNAWRLVQPGTGLPPKANQTSCSWPSSPPNKPEARADASFSYDAQSGRTLLFGGESASGTILGDAWSYDGKVFQLLVSLPCNYTGGIKLDGSCGSGSAAILQILKNRRGASSAYSISDQAIALFGGSDNGGTLSDEGFMLRSLPILGATRTPVHLFRLALAKGEVLHALQIRHEGLGQRFPLNGAALPGLKIYIWVATPDSSSGASIGWVELTPSGPNDSNELFDQDLGSLFADPAFLPANLRVADTVLDNQVWIMVVSKFPADQSSAAELQSDTLVVNKISSR